jgi:hypothetical protein
MPLKYGSGTSMGPPYTGAYAFSSDALPPLKVNWSMRVRW